MSRDAANFSQGPAKFIEIVAQLERESSPVRRISLDEAEAFIGDDPGAAFEPPVLDLLARLEEKDQPAFERLRKRISKTSRIAEVDKALRKFKGYEELAEGDAAHEILLRLASNNAEFFSNVDGQPFARLLNMEKPEIWHLSSKMFRRWLSHLYYRDTGGAPSKEAVTSASNVLEAMALFDGDEYEVHLRTASVQGRIYIDLVKSDWSIVEVHEKGWQVLHSDDIRFRRTTGMLGLPHPENGGDIEELRSLLNLADDNSFKLLVFWLLSALRGTGPYPVLVLNGEQGSAKSTFSKIVRLLTDPSSADLRTLPREEREFFISAMNSHVMAFDNVSQISDMKSDTICRIATGAGASFRQLYTDQDEVMFQVSRPIILNGIGNIVDRADLADRCVFINLKPISIDERKSQSEIMEAFDAVRPAIFGALLDGLAHGLRKLPSISPLNLPRMADFAIWSMACETAYWEEGSFGQAYDRNLTDSVEVMLEDDPLFLVLQRVIASDGLIKETATELLAKLIFYAKVGGLSGKLIPDTADQLGKRLTRMAPNLRKLGWLIEKKRLGEKGERVWIIKSVSPVVSDVSEQLTVSLTDGSDTSDAVD